MLKRIYKDIDDNLTYREEQILNLIVQGLTNNEIATELVISSQTVGCHRTNLMKKLRARKVTDLVWYAARKGFFKWRVYPDYAEDSVYLDLETQSRDDIRICLTDMSGNILMENILSGSCEHYKAELDISELSKGTYLLQMESKSMNARRKIVKR